MKYLCLAALLAGLVPACKGNEVKAAVDCQVAPGSTVECTVQQTKGTAAIEVCWDFRVRCANDATLEAERTCATVKDGETTTTSIPASKLKIEGKCEGEKKAELANLKWSAK